MNATPSLPGGVTIRSAENGFIVVYNSKEYVFLNIGALNNWMAKISAGE